jgi:hypothetical protein
MRVGIQRRQRRQRQFFDAGQSPPRRSVHNGPVLDGRQPHANMPKCFRRAVFAHHEPRDTLKRVDPCPSVISQKNAVFGSLNA